MPTAWLRGVLSRAGELWSKLSTPMRLMVAGLGLAGVLAAAITLRYSQPQYVALPGQPYDPKDLEAVVERLGELGVPYRASADGTMILVPQDKLLNARLALAQAGLFRGPAGYELFEQPRLGATDFERRVNFLRAQEGELSRAISAMKPIRSAVVKLAIPEQTVFVRERKPVKAAVMVEPRTGVELSQAEVEGIVRFLAWSVPELDPENVMVVDHTGRVLMAGLKPEPETPDAMAERHLEKQIAFQRELERQLTQMLERTLGPGNVSVMAAVKMRLESSREEQRRFENAGPGGQPVLRSEQIKTTFFEGTNPPPQLPAGTDANTPVPPSYQAIDQDGGTSTYEARDTLRNYEPNEIYSIVERPPGEIESISVGVFVNEAVVAATDTERLTQIQQVVAQAVGTPPEMVTVATMAFRNDLLEVLKAPPPAPSPNWTWQAVAAGFLALAAVFFFLWLRRRPRLEPALAGAGGMVLPEALEAAAEGAAAAEAPAALAPGAVGAVPAAEAEVPPAADLQRQQFRQEVEKLAQQSPELVASLVKAWIQEDIKGERS